MNVIFCEDYEEYLISDVKCFLNSGLCKVKWTTKKADGFFVFCYSALHTTFDIWEHMKKYLQNRNNEKGIRDESDEHIFISVLMSNFSSNGIEICKKRDMKVPLKVVVVAYTKNGEDIILYRQTENNYDFLPYTIEYTAVANRSLFNINRKTILTIPRFPSFKEGLLYYTIDGRKVKYPVCSTMLAQKLEIKTSSTDIVVLKTHEQYKELFKCIRKEGDR